MDVLLAPEETGFRDAVRDLVGSVAPAAPDEGARVGPGSGAALLEAAAAAGYAVRGEDGRPAPRGTPVQRIILMEEIARAAPFAGLDLAESEPAAASPGAPLAACFLGIAERLHLAGIGLAARAGAFESTLFDAAAIQAGLAQVRVRWWQARWAAYREAWREGRGSAPGRPADEVVEEARAAARDLVRALWRRATGEGAAAATEGLDELERRILGTRPRAPGTESPTRSDR